VLNFMSAPGAGKTTLLERVRPTCRACASVLEGESRLDGRRSAGGPCTSRWSSSTRRRVRGECHLDANMVRSAIPALPLADIDLLIVENVGNLVCPAESGSAKTLA